MAFRTKSFVQVTQSMVAHLRAVQRALTDFNIGSVTRTALIEAPAQEFEELYQAMALGLTEGIPTAIYRSFDFELRPALAASGFISITVPADHTAPITIPVGFVVASKTGIQYRTVTSTTIPVGTASADALIVALTPGTAGNAGIGEVSLIVSSGTFARSVRNADPLANGKGKESEAERKLRFVEFVRALARGTDAAVTYIAKQAVVDSGGALVERVARIMLVTEPGHVFLYLHNGVGATSAALVQRAQELVDGYVDGGTGAKVTGYRPAGMRVEVVAMTETAVPVSLVAQVPANLQTDAMKTRIAVAVGGMIRATPSGANLKPLDLLNAELAVFGIQGGEIVSPSYLVPCPVSGVLVPGPIAVAWKLPAS